MYKNLWILSFHIKYEYLISKLELFKLPEHLERSAHINF